MTWLPVDYAARIILDLCDVNSTTSNGAGFFNPSLVYHVLNPTRFHWTKDMLPVLSAAGLKFEVLPTDQWMEKLRDSDRDPKKNPPIKLLDWFESKYGHGTSSKSKGPLVYLTEETRKKSETLGKITDVTDTQYVRLMIERLQKQWGA